MVVGRGTSIASQWCLLIVNPWRACIAKVTVVVFSVSVSFSYLPPTHNRITKERCQWIQRNAAKMLSFGV